jgi:hypothetical protein
MTYIHSTLFILHILSGTAALILFWVPMFTEKGKLNHVKFGRYYKNTMYTVAGTGAIMALMVLAFPLVIKASMISENTNTELLAYRLRVFWAFLFYLSILSFTVTRHAVAVLRVKNDRAPLRTFRYLLPVALLILGAPVIFYLGYTTNTILHMVFGVLGLSLGLGILRYCLQANIKHRQWVFEHISSIIGSAIGAYTAFIAFGGRVLLSDLGQWQILFWIAPGVIGTIASAILCKKYKKVFNLQGEVLV